MSVLDGLNEPQRHAASIIHGPVLILAGAGSGKTRTLTVRLAHLIDQGVPPYRILAVTFTNKAAQEMKERVIALVGSRAASGIWMGTFHSICARILREDGDRIGLDANFTIYDTDDSKTLLRRICRRRSIDEKILKPNTVRERISAAKNTLIGPAEYAQEHSSDPRTPVIAELYAEYQGELRANNAVDFDDLLVLPVEMFAQHPDILEKWQERFEHLLIDEYQDTNRAQYMLVKHLASRHQNICAVGDDDQSIYGWRGADIANILSFESDFPDAAVIRLEQNYRSTGNILKAAGAVVSNNTARKGKDLWTEQDDGDPITAAALEDDQSEAQWVRSRIEKLREEGFRFGDIAVLYRTNAQSRAVEESFVRSRTAIPYTVVGGLKFYDRKEVKDILAYLRVIDNPRDMESLRRIINVPKRGIGQRTIEKLVEATEETGYTLLDVIKDSSLNPVSERSQQGEAMRRLTRLLDDLSAKKADTPVHVLVERVIQESGYRASLQEEGTVEAETREQNIEELLAGAASFAEAAESEGRDSSVSAFLQEVSLFTDVDTIDDESDVVTLMTLHSAKGLEYPVVFLTGLEESLFPLGGNQRTEEELEEERRLFYVGLTRAEKRVHISHALRRRRYGEYLDSSPSRFLDELPPELLQWERATSGSNRGAARTSRDSGGFGNRFSRPLTGRNAASAPRRIANYREPEQATGGNAAAQPEDDFSQPMPEYDDFSQATEDFLEVGRYVQHPAFGRGKIVGHENSGADLKLTINFDKRGKKKLIARLAQLEPCH